MSIRSIQNYLSLVKFSHTIFAMPFALVGFFLGLMKISYESSLPLSLGKKTFLFGDFELGTLGVLALVVLCMVFARSAAMAFNRYIDEHFDKLNPRTAIREIPSGIIPKKHAFWFVVLNCLLFIITTFFINKICFYLSPVALFVILFYSYTKRFTPLCHLVLGVGLSLAPIGAYLAITGHFDVLPILFSFTVFTWVSAFDILYALQDEEFDRSHQLNSIPVLLGRKNALLTARLLHLITASIIVYTGFYGHFSTMYWIGAVVFISLLFFQHTLVKVNDISKINLAFGTTNGIASLVFASFVILSLFLN